MRGYRTRLERLTFGRETYEILAPAHGEALLDDPRVIERFAEDEYMPYWAMLWPAALLLADAVATWPVVGGDDSADDVLELGCGLGLAGIVAASRGYAVTVTDHDEDALAFAVANAERNQVRVATRVLDWRAVEPPLGCTRIIAADVLYEARHVVPIAEFISRHLKPGGFAWVADPERRTADQFEIEARRAGLIVHVRPVHRPDTATKRPIAGRLFELRRRGSAVI